VDILNIKKEKSRIWAKCSSAGAGIIILAIIIFRAWGAPRLLKEFRPSTENLLKAVAPAGDHGFFYPPGTPAYPC